MDIQLYQGDFKRSALGRMQAIRTAQELMQQIGIRLCASPSMALGGGPFGRAIRNLPFSLEENAYDSVLLAVRDALTGLPGVYIKDASVSKADSTLQIQLKIGAGKEHADD